MNTSNQSMKPTAPPGNGFSELATTPCRGLSPSSQMSRGLTILTACLVVWAHQANARLGETPGELGTRYGGGAKTIDAPPGETALEYKYKDFLIMITFVDGKSAQEIYVHHDLKTELSDSESSRFWI